MIYGETPIKNNNDMLDSNNSASKNSKHGDIDKLRNIDFSKVEQYDPSREDGFSTFSFEKQLPITIMLDPSSQKEHGNLTT